MELERRCALESENEAMSPSTNPPGNKGFTRCTGDHIDTTKNIVLMVASLRGSRGCKSCSTKGSPKRLVEQEVREAVMSFRAKLFRCFEGLLEEKAIHTK